MSKRRHRSGKLPAEPVTLDISSLNHEGRGVAHIDGKVAFVDGALAGEQVSASFVRRRGKFDELNTLEVLQPAKERVVPPCEYAGLCGGCSLQHMDSDAQIEFKQSVLVEQIQHAAGMSLEAVQLLPQLKDATAHYRRKARLAIRVVNKKGGALVGFREKYSGFITDMHDCKVLTQEVAALINPLRELITHLLGSHSIPQIEVAVGEAGENESALRVALVIRHMHPLI